VKVLEECVYIPSCLVQFLKRCVELDWSAGGTASIPPTNLFAHSSSSSSATNTSAAITALACRVFKSVLCNSTHIRSVAQLAAAEQCTPALVDLLAKAGQARAGTALAAAEVKGLESTILSCLSAVVEVGGAAAQVSLLWQQFSMLVYMYIWHAYLVE